MQRSVLSRVFATGDMGAVSVMAPKARLVVSACVGKSRFRKPDAAMDRARSSERWPMVIWSVRRVRSRVAVWARRVVASGGTFGARGTPCAGGVFDRRIRENAADESVSAFLDASRDAFVDWLSTMGSDPHAARPGVVGVRPSTPAPAAAAQAVAS